MDTRNKRASALGFALAFRLVLPAPDGTIDQADRQQTAYSYPGILAANPIPDVFPVLELGMVATRDVALTADATRTVGLSVTAVRDLALVFGALPTEEV